MKIVLIFALHLISDPCCGGSKTETSYLGETVTITCPYPEEFKSKPVYLSKSNRTHSGEVPRMIDTQRGRFSISDNRRSDVLSVRISDVREDDGGVYYCAVWISGSPVSYYSLYTETQLDVMDPCCGVSKTVTGYLGETVTISCPYPEEFKSKPVYLCKSNRTHSAEVPRFIDPQRDRFSISENRRPDIQISDVREDDGGGYYCAVWISESSVSYYSLYTEIQLDVMGRVSSFDVMGYQGGQVMIFCTDTDYGFKEKYFCKLQQNQCLNKVVTTPNSWTQTERLTLIDSPQRNHTGLLMVMFRNLSSQDAGLYQCGETGVWSHTVNLTVNSDPCCGGSKTVTGYLGETVTISCPYPEEFKSKSVYLYKSTGKHSVPNIIDNQRGKFSISNNRSSEVVSVRISDVREADGGVYYCGASHGGRSVGYFSLFTEIQLDVMVGSTQWLSGAGTGNWDAVSHTSGDYEELRDSRVYSTIPFYSLLRRPTIPSGHPKAMYTLAKLPKIPSDPVNAVYATAQAPTIPSDPANAAYATAPVPTIPSDPANSAYATAQVPTIPSGHPKAMYTLAELPKIPSDPFNAVYDTALVPTIPSDPANAAYATAQVPTIPSGHPKTMYTLAELPTIPSDPANAAYATAQEPTIPSDPVNAVYATAPVPTIPSDPANAAYATAQVPTIPSDPANAAYVTAPVPKIPSDPTNAAYATAQVPTIPSGHPKAMYTRAELPKIPSDPFNAAYATAQVPTIPSDPTNAKHATAQTPTIPSDPTIAAYANAQVPTIPSDPTNTEHATAQRTYPNNRPSVSRLIIILDKTNDCCIICKLQGFDGGVHQGRVGSFDVMGYPGGQVMIFCTDTDYGIKEKFFCKLQQNQCLNKLVTTQNSWTQTERLSLIDSPTVNHTGRLTVMFRNLSSQDAGLYQCGETGVWSHNVNPDSGNSRVHAVVASKTWDWFIWERRPPLPVHIQKELKIKVCVTSVIKQKHSAEVPQIHRYSDRQTEAEYENDPPQNQNIIMNPAYQNLKLNTNQLESVYQTLNPNTNQSDSVYQSLNQNTNQLALVYQNLTPNTNQSASVYQTLNPNINQSHSVYQTLNPNTNQSDSVYQSLNQNTNQSASAYQSLNPNTNQSASAYQNLKTNTNQLDSVYQSLNRNTNQSASVYQSLNQNTNQSALAYQNLSPNTNQSASVYQTLNPNIIQSHSVYQTLNPNTNQSDSVYQSLNQNTNQSVLGYQNVSPNTNQSDSVYQILNPNTNQSDSVYQSLNQNTNQSASAYQSLNPNTNQSASVYQSLNPNTNQSVLACQSVNPNTNQSALAYQSLNPNINQSASVNQTLNHNINQSHSVYQTLNPNTYQSALAYQSLNPNTNQSALAYQSLNPNTNQSASVYQSLNPNTNQSALVYQTLNPNTNESASVYQTLNPNSNNQI
ncbi:hypothetical protein NFI96_008175, partial [Prochilodus magdalenae]